MLPQVVRMRASHIPLVASLAGGLAPYHDSLGVGLVDAVMEDVRWGLDHPNAGTSGHGRDSMPANYNYFVLLPSHEYQPDQCMAGSLHFSAA